jgi:hypothetical protein
MPFIERSELDIENELGLSLHRKKHPTQHEKKENEHHYFSEADMEIHRLK